VTSLDLAVIGIGLISPAAATSRENVFFLRAGATLPSPSPFLNGDDESIPVGYCPWIQPFEDLERRLVALAANAVEESAAPLHALKSRGELRVAPFACLPSAGSGLADEALARVAAEPVKGLGSAPVDRAAGAAGVFRALREAADRLRQGAADMALVFAVDSWMSAPALAARRLRPPNPWLPSRPEPAEGAAAMLITTARTSARLGLRPLGHIRDSRATAGSSNDQNDDVVDGAAMTSLLYTLSPGSPIRWVYGQSGVDLLRSREWNWAVARMADRFHPEYFDACLEAEVGDIGAAAGLANLVYGFASLRHGAAPAASDPQTPFAAWAVSADGTRGVALCEVAAS
jgi:hypothetical protein